ncbi:heterogeneous nuclear ribonucleoprotein 1-like [Tripterygium wilfordii]|nr:heterogeneous nuclear ribonucleoprotein 1-like [Tripterygium wilfordii]
MEMELGKLFIGGVSWDTNEDRLREYFQNFGEVLEAVIMKDRATGRGRGFGFVVFADPTVAERVVMAKHLIDGRAVEAKKAVPRDYQNNLNRNNNSIHGSPGPVRTKKIFVGGLASTVTENDFKKYFDQFGTIKDVVVMYDQNTQRPRGFGFITYDSEGAVDRVLYKTFHELNGKMVEVKRAVPKELSPGPSRSPLSGNNYGLGPLGRFSSSFNGYTQGYNPSPIGGYGARIDGRFSPVTVGRGGFTPFGLSNGMGLNFEPALGASYGQSANHNSNLNFGRLNSFSSPIGNNGGNEGNNSMLNLTGRTLWGDGDFSYSTSSANSTRAGSGIGNSAMGSIDSIGTLWESSLNSAPSGGAGSAYSSGSLGYPNGDVSIGSGGAHHGKNGSAPGGGAGSAYRGFSLGYGNGHVSIGSGGAHYGKNSGTSVAPASSHAGRNGGYDGVYADHYDNGSFYGGSTWQSSPSVLERTGSFGFGHGSVVSDVMTKNSAGYVGGYGVANRQSQRGIAA